MKSVRPILFLITLFLLSPFYGTSQNWNQDQKIVSPDRHVSDRFGSAVSISGNYAIIGAFNEDYDNQGINYLENAGAAYIFECDSLGNWLQVQRLVIDTNREAGDLFGKGVDIYGEYAIVGAPGKNSPGKNKGAAYIYKRHSNGIWVQQAYIGGSYRPTGSGGVVAISNDYALIGGERSFEKNKAIKLYVRNGNSWDFQGYKNGWPNNVQRQGYGSSLDIWEDDMLVGARRDVANLPYWQWPGVGALYYYKAGAFMQKIHASDAALGNEFGFSSAIDSNLIVVGSPKDDLNESGIGFANSAGSAYVFVKDANNFISEVQKLTPSDRQANDQFGFSVSISGGRILVGAPFEDHDPTGSAFTTNSGSVYAFEQDSSGTWIETAKITAGNRGAFDLFGRSVCMDNDFAISGVFEDDEDENEANFLYNAGAAYVFSSCSQLVTQTASVCEGDTFYFFSQQITSAGQYQHTYSGTGGCDTIIQLNLTLLPTQFYDTAAVCQGESYLWQNQILTQAGTYQETLLNTNGCDSVLHLSLNVNPVYTIPDTQIICLGDSFLFGSQVLTQSGTFTEVYATVNGCDSTINLALNVIEHDSGISQAGYTLTSSDSLASYQWLSCDNAYSPVSGATDRSFWTTQNGSYAVALDRGGCRDTSDCIQILCPKDGFEPNDRASEASNLFGGALFAGQNMRLCPGGDEDWFYTQINMTSTLVVRLEDLSANYQLEVYTSGNSLVGSSILPGLSDEKVIRHNVPPGMYYIRVYGENNSWHPDPYTLIANSILPSSQFGIGIKPIAQSSVVKSEKDFLVEVYPNPVEEALTIEFGEMQMEGRLSLYNSLGQEMMGVGFVTSKSLEMDVSGFPEGIYLLKILSSQGAKAIRLVKR